MAHYFSEKQDSVLKIKKINIFVKNKGLELYTAQGVFSKDRLDRGTEILIENCIIEKGWDILDMGCGIGVIGIAIRLFYPETKVLMVDINERALMLAKKNIELNKLEDISADKSNLYSNVKSKFDTILVNPPQAAGKKVCFEIIEKAPLFLKKDGLLQLVARHKKGGSTLKEKMLEIFGNAEEIAKESGYRVYVSRF